MIYCFSGTGNSEFVADKLKGLVDDTEDTFGMVFPVYAWGIPQIVEKYIKEHKQDIEAAHYVYVVLTCGDDMGYADKILNKLIDSKLNAAFSVPMPNTYVCLPGFDVDSDEVADGKVRKTLEMLPTIAEAINNREAKTEVHRGACAWLKTYVLRPIFNRFLVTDKYFHTTKDCKQCKRCVRGCPLGNISMEKNGKVVWKHEQCTGCLRCYHRCPTNAVQFGRFTKNKGQKTHDFDR